MELQKSKVYSVKDCSDLLGINEQQARRYIDEFKLGTREKSTNGVERRILEEKDFDRLSEIVELKEKGFTPKTIGLLLSSDLTVVSKDRLRKIEKTIEDSFKKYGQEYLEMQQKIEQLEQKNQKMLETKEDQEEKDKKIEELSEIVYKLDSKVKLLQEEKNQLPKEKVGFFKKLFGSTVGEKEK